MNLPLLLKMAWRNVWRNSRRSAITITAIGFAVTLSTLTRSTQEGSYNRMIQNTAVQVVGHAQIQHVDYWANRSIHKLFSLPDSLIHHIEARDEVIFTNPQLQSFALAAGTEKSKAALLFGIDPIKEDQISHLSQKITAGNYFNSNNNGLLLGEGLASSLALQVGDSVILMGQGYHGVSANGIFPIQGLIRFPAPEQNNTLIYFPLDDLQRFLGASNLLSGLSILAKNGIPSNELKHVVEPLLPKDEPILIATWQTLLPDLVQVIEADRGGGLIMLWVLYMVVGFGLFGTLLMMMAERTYEFGVMLSVGTPRTTLLSMIVFELTLLTSLGLIAGLTLALPIITYLHLNPIPLSGDMAAMMESYGMEAVIPFALQWDLFSYQLIVISGMMLFISIYPTIKLLRLPVLKALKGELQ